MIWGDRHSLNLGIHSDPLGRRTCCLTWFEGRGWILFFGRRSGMEEIQASGEGGGRQWWEMAKENVGGRFKGRRPSECWRGGTDSKRCGSVAVAFFGVKAEVKAEG